MTDFAPYRTRPPDPHANRDYWRWGRYLVVLDDAELPDRCIRCNEPTGGAGHYARVLRPWFFHRGAIACMLLPLCPRHLRRRAELRFARLMVWPAIATAVVLLGHPYVVPAVAAMLAALAFVACGHFAESPATLVDAGVGWRMLRVGRPFIESLPDTRRPAASTATSALPSPTGRAFAPVPASPTVLSQDSVDFSVGTALTTSASGRRRLQHPDSVDDSAPGQRRRLQHPHSVDDFSIRTAATSASGQR